MNTLIQFDEIMSLFIARCRAVVAFFCIVVLHTNENIRSASFEIEHFTKLLCGLFLCFPPSSLNLNVEQQGHLQKSKINVLAFLVGYNDLLSEHFTLKFFDIKTFCSKKITLRPIWYQKLKQKRYYNQNLFILVRIKRNNHKHVQDLSVCLDSVKTTSFTKL